MQHPVRQGGIAAAIGPDDSPALHQSDTEGAGAGLNDRRHTRILTEEGPERIADLIRFGVPFDTLDGEIALAREGAHSLGRVLHAVAMRLASTSSWRWPSGPTHRPSSFETTASLVALT